MPNFVPKKPEKDVISIRMPTELLSAVDMAAAGYDISRNEFINQCILFALDNMPEKDNN